MSTKYYVFRGSALACLIWLIIELFVWNFLPSIQGRFHCQSSFLFHTQNLSMQVKPTNKIILFWSSLYVGEHWDVGSGSKTFQRLKCPVQACEFTFDKTRLDQSNAVLFHIPLLDVNDLPKSRQPNQCWVFFDMESPRLQINLSKVESMFNWTMTYRMDSEIKVLYGDVKKKIFPPGPKNMTHNATYMRVTVITQLEELTM